MSTKTTTEASQLPKQTRQKEQNAEHEFKGSWRWTERFEAWVETLLNEADGQTANIFAGLSHIGDVRVDLHSPVELIKNLQEDDDVGLKRARKCLEGLVDENAPGDIIEPLFNAENPKEHPASKYIKTGTTIKTDILSDPITLPLETNSCEAIVCDPPWKQMSERTRSDVFEELIRITQPGGMIILNNYSIQTGKYPITLDHTEKRQDLERAERGIPNISWASVYTVYESTDLLTYPRSPLGRNENRTPEFQPEADSPEELARAAAVHDLTHINGFPFNSYETDIIDPATDTECPMCGCTDLDPMGENMTDTFDRGELYECPNCEFRATESELV